MRKRRQMTEEEKAEVERLESEFGEGFRLHGSAFFSSDEAIRIGGRIRELSFEQDTDEWTPDVSEWVPDVSDWTPDSHS